MVEVEGTTVEVESVKTSLVNVDSKAVGPEIEDDCSSVRFSVVVDVTDCEAGIGASVLVGMGVAVAVESDDGEDIELDGKPVAPPLPPTAEEVGEEDEGRCERAGSAPGELSPVPPPPVEVEFPAVDDLDGRDRKESEAERERDDGDADADGDGDGEGGMIEDAEGADEDVSCEPVCVVGVVSNEGTARFDEDPFSVEGVVEGATVPVCDDGNGIKAGDDGPRSVSVSATATATAESESLPVARFDARCGGTVMRSRSEGDE